MGWGTSWNEDMYISKERFETEYEWDSKIDETKKYIQDIREKILMACMNGKDAFETSDCEGNKCDVVDVIHIRVGELLELFLEYNDKLYMYKSLKTHFKERENT